MCWPRYSPSRRGIDPTVEKELSPGTVSRLDEISSGYSVGCGAGERVPRVGIHEGRRMILFQQKRVCGNVETGQSRRFAYLHPLPLSDSWSCGNPPSDASVSLPGKLEPDSAVILAGHGGVIGRGVLPGLAAQTTQRFTGFAHVLGAAGRFAYLRNCSPCARPQLMDLAAVPGSPCSSRLSLSP